jgi:hypothetical protein
METWIERKFRREEESLLAKIGKYETVERFMRKYGNLRTRAVYLGALHSYLECLKSQGVGVGSGQPRMRRTHTQVDSFGSNMVSRLSTRT